MAYEFKGPRLLDEVVRLLDEQKYTCKRCADEFGVSTSWRTEIRKGQRPNVDKLQEVYERLSGRALIRRH